MTTKELIEYLSTVEPATEVRMAVRLIKFVQICYGVVAAGFWGRFGGAQDGGRL